MYGHTEMNVSFSEQTVVRPLRCDLLEEHLGLNTEELDIRSALRVYRKVAEENRLRRDDGDHDWQGLAYRLDPAIYGE
jgi:cardiolipin synthase